MHRSRGDTAILERNKRIVQRVYDEVWNTGNLAVVDELIAVDCLRHDPSSPEDTGGSDAFKERAAEIRAAFPDLRLVIEDILADGDRVATRSRFTGTHEGALMGIPATGKKVDVTALEIVRIEDGRIAEIWRVGDTLGFMHQLGLMQNGE